ncbi:hypothetical protein BH10ACT2_BH10ACT2_06660 [soil metagenome]
MAKSGANTPLLLASAHGRNGQSGGVFAVSENDCELLDRLPTSGMAISPDATRLARLTWLDGEGDLSELIISDASGLLTYRRLDEVRESHSLMWHGSELYAVSTGSNCIVVLDDAGRTMRTLLPAGPADQGDRCHLNSVAVAGDRIIVSAFGIFDAARGWNSPGALDGAGVVLDVATGDVVLSGFDAPHDPTWVEDGWLICNSFSGDVLRLDVDGQRTASTHLGGWTRGVLVAGDIVYVGISAHQLANSRVRAQIAVLELATLKQIGLIDMPSKNVFALLAYDEGLANGLRVGANVGVVGQIGSPTVVMDRALDAAESLAKLNLRNSTTTGATVRLTNLSNSVLSGFGKHPVRVGARWWDDSINDWVDVARGGLDTPLYPNAAVEVRLKFPSLPPAGKPFQICVLQEEVRWFDEVCPDAAIELYPPPA